MASSASGGNYHLFSREQQQQQQQQLQQPSHYLSSVASLATFSEIEAERIWQMERKFHHYGMLSDDLRVHIVSFVCEAPFEDADMSPIGTLTHVLPLVCRQFHMFCVSSENLWTEALIRRIELEPDLWEAGLKNILKNNELHNKNQHPSNYSPHSSKEEETNALVQCACEALGNEMAKQPSRLLYTAIGSIAKAQLVYRYIVKYHLRYSGPVFYMPAQVSLGREFGLHFFEPRYRLLIAEVMEGRPQSDFLGSPLEELQNTNCATNNSSSSSTPDRKVCGAFFSGRPFFIYANYAPLAPGSPAVIVEVRRCRMYSNGTADVILVPISHVWMETITVRPSSGGLCDARVVRMGREGSRAMEASVIRGH